MIEHSATITELLKALHAAQGELTGVQKAATNSHFRTKYATLESVLDTARPALQAHGLIVTQAPGKLSESCIEITTMIAHTSGEWMRSTLHMPVPKRDPQGVGSAITYGLRYSLMAVLAIPPSNDDDGEAAMPDRGKPAPQPQREKSQLQDRPSPEADPAVRAWVKEVERCASRADLTFLFRSEEWATAKAQMSPEGQKIVQDALARHPEYQGRAAA